jgi:tRNA pseudouridine38-40 synthase
MERNLLFTMRFEGTRYHGFQVQRNALGVCEVFQDAVERVFGVRHDVKGCSRTDTGVHAAGYCVSMKTCSAIACDKIPLALNMHLPEDIAVISCEDVPRDFHARYSATGKEYIYNLHNSRIRDPFSANFCYRMSYPLDALLLDREAKGFLGTHDFAAFQAKGGDVADTVRTVTGFTVAREGETVRFAVKGDGFLYKMVRIMVGTLINIGTGKLVEGSIPDIIKSRDRSRAGKTAPACGLILNRVFYDN